MQQNKLNTAAKIFMDTANHFDGDLSLLPLWGAGVVTHGQPKGENFVIGITEAAADFIKRGQKKDITLDHLFRVTETAKVILEAIKAGEMTVAKVEELLLERAKYMKTTRAENHKVLKQALKHLHQSKRDDWKELYNKAGIKYRLF